MRNEGLLSFPQNSPLTPVGLTSSQATTCCWPPLASTIHQHISLDLCLHLFHVPLPTAVSIWEGKWLAVLEPAILSALNKRGSCHCLLVLELWEFVIRCSWSRKWFTLWPHASPIFYLETEVVLTFQWMSVHFQFGAWQGLSFPEEYLASQTQNDNWRPTWGNSISSSSKKAWVQGNWSLLFGALPNIGGRFSCSISGPWQHNLGVGDDPLASQRGKIRLVTQQPSKCHQDSW